jgi:hypothetical protein
MTGYRQSSHAQERKNGLHLHVCVSGTERLCIPNPHHGKTERQGVQDHQTLLLRVMLLTRFLENVAGFATVLLLPALNPCSLASSDLRYLSEYCRNCCRGPIVYFEFVVAMSLASSMYVFSWFAGWYLDNFYFTTDF